MGIEKCIKEAKRLKGYGLEALVVRIGEVYKKHMSGEEITDTESLIIGLRYSEFLADGSNDEDFRQASIKQDVILDILGIDYHELVNMCEDICNLR